MEILIVIITNIIDRLTKIVASGSLKGGNDIVIIRNIFDFSYVENRGAAWGVMQNKINILLIVTIIVVAGIIYFLLKYKPKNRLERISLGLIIGGALGNMYDRAVYGYVVDFIDFHYKDVYSFPVFNFADMCVVVGTALLIFHLIKEDSNEKSI
ncbi:MAG: signal peptidase II [Clostridium sp.]|nr:signal peptidase II [Clostridium sp.]